MTTSPAHTKSYFNDMSARAKTRFLAALSHNLTVSARAAWSDHESAQAKLDRLIAINELEHLVTGQLTSFLTDSEFRYEDDAFIDILFAQARQTACESHLIAALELSRSIRSGLR